MTAPPALRGLYRAGRAVIVPRNAARRGSSDDDLHDRQPANESRGGDRAGPRHRGGRRASSRAGREAASDVAREREGDDGVGSDAADAPGALRRVRRRLARSDQCLQRGRPGLRLDRLVPLLPPPSPMDLRVFPGCRAKCVFGTAPDPKFVVSFAPVGKVRPVAGGWELSGEWPWGSGGDHCDWGMVIALVPGPERDRLQARMFLLLPGQFHMRDVWHSVGLKGSGTNNIVVDPIFVPAEYTLDLQQARDGTAPGCSLDDGVLFRSSLTAQTWIRSEEHTSELQS